MSSAAEKVSTGVDPLLPPGVSRADVWAAGVRFSVLRATPGRAVGRPVLLLHGVPQTALAWHDLLPELGRDRVVLAPDLKGLGQSEIRGPYDIATLVGELAALVEAECGVPVDVVGHDWGGALAIALTGARPDLVRRLVVVNAPYREVNLRRAWHMPLFALPVVPELLFATVGRQFWDRLAFGVAWRGPELLSPELRQHYLDAYADPQRTRAMLDYYRGTVRPRIKALPGRALHKALGRPVAAARAKPEQALVVWGTADPTFPRAIGERVARDLGADFAVAEGSGHFPVEENPRLVVPVIADFLRAGDDANGSRR